MLAGGYTREKTGCASPGISRLTLGPEGTIAEAATLAAVESPSFLAAHPTLPVVYAALENRGAVVAVNTETGDIVGREKPAGPSVCHVSVSPAGTLLVACCWASGEVISYPLDADGAPGEPRTMALPEDPHAEIAAGPDAVAQPANREPRAHASVFVTPDTVLTSDLGFDLVRVWRVNGTELTPVEDVTFPYATGPRHFALTPGGKVLVITEYSCQVAVLSRSQETQDGHGKGSWQLDIIGPATAEPVRQGDSGAEITVNAAGDRAYAGIRGSNRISVLKLEEDDEGLTVTPLEDFDSGGEKPRFHLLDGDRLYVAHQGSSDIQVIAIDNDGLLAESLQSFPLGTPSCLALAARR